MISGILTFFYFNLCLLGLAISSARLLARLPMLAPLPLLPRAIIGLATLPALTSLTAFSGVYRIPFLLPLLGLAAAIYGILFLYMRRYAIARQAHALLRPTRNWPLLAFGALLLGTFLAVNWCSFAGGSNNWPLDYIRGASITTALTANYLKPAFALDLALPLSYGYYSFALSAFLYGSIEGFGWPSVAVLAMSLAGVALFYYAFLRLCRQFMPQVPLRWMVFVGVGSISFFGLDVFVAGDLGPMEHIDWWNPLQITQMASQWSWVAHYLLAAGLGILGLTYLCDGVAQRAPAYFIAGLMLLALSPLYAAITGAFMIAVTFFMLILFTLSPQSRAPFIQVMKATLTKLHYLIAFTLLAYTPQSLTFIGRQDYLQFSQPGMWMVLKPMMEANRNDFIRLLSYMSYELGPLLMLGLTVVPLMIRRLYASLPLQSLLALSLLLSIIVCNFFIQASSMDWYWRAGALGSTVLAALSATWLLIRFDAALLRVLGILLMLPGGYNFFYEHYLRYEGCFTPPDYLWMVNREVNVHTAIATSSLDPMQVMLAGRLAIEGNHPAWPALKGHTLPSRELRQWFGYPHKSEPCWSNWYGNSIPNKGYVIINSHIPQLNIERHLCP